MGLKWTSINDASSCPWWYKQWLLEWHSYHYSIFTCKMHIQLKIFFKIQMVCYRFVDFGLLHTFNTKHVVLYTLWYKYQTQTGKTFQMVFTGVYSLDLSVSTEKHSFMLKIIILNQTIKISKPCIYESS